MDRLNYPVSFVKGTFDTGITGYRTVGQLLQFIANPTDEFRKISDNMALWAKTNKPKYKRQKKDLHGFIMGKFDTKRNNNNLVEYTPLIPFDIDGCSKQEQLEDLFSLAANSPYIFACFPSPSRKGLRVLVWADSVVKKGKDIAAWKATQATLHREYHQAIADHLAMNFGIGTEETPQKRKPFVDLSIKAMCQYYFFTVQPDMFYYNPKAATFTDLPIRVEKEPPTPLKITHQHEKDISNLQKLDLIYEIVESRGKARNASSYDIACLANTYGVPQDECLAYVNTYIVSYVNTGDKHAFPKHEAQKAIQSGYNSSDTNSRNTPQLIAYAKRSLGETSFWHHLRKNQPLATQRPTRIDLGSLRLWVLFQDASQVAYRKKYKHNGKTFLSKGQGLSKKDEINALIADLYTFFSKFEGDTGFRLQVKYLWFQDIKDTSKIYFKCRTTGVVYGDRDTETVEELIGENVIEQDAQGRLFLIPLYDAYQERKQRIQTEKAKQRAGNR